MMTITKGVAPAGTGTNGTGDVANVPAPSGSDQSAGDYPPSMDEVRGLREEAKRHRFAGRAAESERDPRARRRAGPPRGRADRGGPDAERRRPHRSPYQEWSSALRRVTRVDGRRRVVGD